MHKQKPGTHWSVASLPGLKMMPMLFFEQIAKYFDLPINPLYMVYFDTSYFEDKKFLNPHNVTLEDSM